MKKIELYTRPGCGYCEAAKRLLNSRGINFIEYNVYVDNQRFNEMRERTKNRTFPQIFIDDDNIGGFTELLEVDL